MRRLLACLMLCASPLPFGAGLAIAAEDTVEIGHVNTAITNLGLTRSHRVVVERFTDPEVRGVSCYISQARTGGLSGMLGVAEDPARFALTCTATGPVEVQPGARRGERGEVVFESSTSLFFKETRVHRFLDTDRNAVVYLAWSTRLIDGSPFNAVAVVPVR
ncbi:CreA family protein [Falsiroseomonas selenitidurans]|uniref:CreA family protein n=1 Tax=Falsiroseomonas selenitidurans TaxID=2716335 RepID=A0ABX1DWP8_9PROT|nr:CreA family protein [Falsiroseomonas selenitidurans]NKC29291.1 CreA family protein [Falsiroseomonas selenitidurans]